MVGFSPHVAIVVTRTNLLLRYYRVICVLAALVAENLHTPKTLTQLARKTLRSNLAKLSIKNGITALSIFIVCCNKNSINPAHRLCARNAYCTRFMNVLMG